MDYLITRFMNDEIIHISDKLYVRRECIQCNPCQHWASDNINMINQTTMRALDIYKHCIDNNVPIPYHFKKFKTDYENFINPKFVKQPKKIYSIFGFRLNW